MQNYPKVLNEVETIWNALHMKCSLARFGDGELCLAAGPPSKACKTQGHHPRLQQELQQLLRGPTKAMVCLPRIDESLPGYERHWKKFLGEKWCAMISNATYGSSFISRPDQAPEIDTPEYWADVCKLWEDRDAILVIGHPTSGKDHSLVPNKLRGATNVRTIRAPQTDAYRCIDELEREIKIHLPGIVLLCLGATATVLAERLARAGVQALDLGHIGRFMK